MFVGSKYVEFGVLVNRRVGSDYMSRWRLGEVGDSLTGEYVKK